MNRQVPVCVWLAAASVAVMAQSPSPQPAPPLLDDKRLVLQADHILLSEATNIYGDPSKPGNYVLRSKRAPNTKTRPRFYDQDRWVTVLKGTLWVGEGAVFRTDKLVPLHEGGLMYQPANLRVYDMAGDAGVILQVTGSGPVKATHAEVDANGQPVAIGGPYPEEAQPEPVGRGRGRGGRRGQPPPRTQPNQ